MYSEEAPVHVQRWQRLPLHGKFQDAVLLVLQMRLLVLLQVQHHSKLTVYEPGAEGVPLHLRQGSYGS